MFEGWGEGWGDLHFWEMVFRTTLSFAALLLLTRLLGKKQMSQLTFFHYITGITIGSIAANIAGESETPFWNGLLSLVIWALLTVLLSYITLKWGGTRMILDNEPTIVIKDGRIDEQAMKSVQLHLDDLNMMLRENGVFAVKDVQYAVLETNGALSVLQKVTQLPATKKDVKAGGGPSQHMPSEIIADGRVNRKNLKSYGLSEQWLLEEIGKHGVARADQVFFAQLQEDGTLDVTLKQPKMNK
ncbi:YetF domain-containing protein [Bhargavaea beijingensis]|uniref:DUF421 domain-containing protein n=1 Tax=Bhargavaea beijingensis TaxID=426756 RepID=A0A1G7BXI7_9BACL|nr:DUF421 domain-containing protein [Bhargavaea beijingensis]MCW1926670.1 DUF421 domain-containing protein [Bhargavaea beijingensis]RSK37074.1 DUF421 domain-containing protein [Bhargavaea beijingensis]SDE31136.1 Uncharacterized membrane protein YcaP, DUF421 family [Bhargavaea beijingensis]